MDSQVPQKNAEYHICAMYGAVRCRITTNVLFDDLLGLHDNAG